MKAWLAPCRCAELGEECGSCLARIERAESRDEPDTSLVGGFDPDYHYPRDLAPRGL